MTEILIRKTNRDIVLEMVEPKDVDRVYDDLAYALRESFASMPQNPITAAETRRRFEMAFKIWVTLRAEFDFTLDRLRAALPNALLLEMLGLDWEPKDVKRKNGRRKGWSPDGYQNAAQSMLPVGSETDPRHVTHELTLVGFPERAKL